MPESQASAPFDLGIFLLHRNKGKEYFQRQQLNEACTELEAAMRIRPDDDNVLNLIGMVYFRLNRLEEAKTVYHQLIAKNPAVYSLQSNLGLIYLKQNRYADAETHFRQAADIEPDNPKARMYLGLIYERLRDYVRALEQYRLARNAKMVTQMEQLLQRLAEKGEPLPLPVQLEEPPPEEPVQQAAVAVPPSEPPARHRPDELPEHSAEFAMTARPEITARIRRIVVREPREEVAPPAVEHEIAAPRVAPSVEPSVLAQQLAATPLRVPTPPVIPPAVVVAPVSGEIHAPPEVAPAVSSKPQALNLAVLLQPSQPNLKHMGDEFRIVSKSYLDVAYQHGMIAGTQRIIGASAVISGEPYAGIDGLVQCMAAGRLLFYEDQFRVYLLRLTGEFVFVKPGYVIAVQPTLNVQAEESALFRFLRLEGDGIVAIAVSTVPILFDISDDRPLIADAGYLAALSTAEPVRLNPSKRPGFVEVSGRGSVLLFPATRIV